MKFAASAHFEAGKNRVTGIFDFTYISLGDSIPIPPTAEVPPGTEADYTYKIFQWELLGAYRATPLDLPQKCRVIEFQAHCVLREKRLLAKVREHHGGHAAVLHAILDHLS